jgi:hypothetical protein|nr:MAG TPA: hypothetical protein [Caudoviricetes sp.]
MLETGTVKEIVAAVLADRDAKDLEDLAGVFGVENGNSEFCDVFELGDWFFEQLDMLGIDIGDMILGLAAEAAGYSQDELFEGIRNDTSLRYI